MANDVSTQGIIDDIKRVGGFPDGLFSDNDYLEFMNCVYSNEMLPFIMKHREDYYTTYLDSAATDTIEIPSDAIGGKIKDVVLVDSSNNFLNVPRLTVEEISCLYAGALKPFGFYIQDNTLKFYPAGANTLTIRVYYFKRPNYLSLTSESAKILSVSGSDVVVDAVPTGWTIATEIDLISHLQPYVVTTTYTISNIVSTTITLSASGAVKGNYICEKGYSCVPKIPFELRDLLVKGSIEHALLAIKDTAGLEAIKKDIKELKEDLAILISPRCDGEVKKIVNNSGIWNQNKSRYGLFRRY